jgi:hypothetical protein
MSNPQVTIGKIEAKNGNVDDKLHLNSGDGILLAHGHTDLLLLSSKGQPTDGGGQSLRGWGRGRLLFSIDEGTKDDMASKEELLFSIDDVDWLGR